MNFLKNLLSLLVVGLLIPFSYTAEKVGIFADDDVTSTKLAGDIVGPLRFAAEDVKKALVVQKYDVEVLPLSSLTVKYPHKKIVLVLSNNGIIASSLKISAPTKLRRLVGIPGIMRC